MVRINDEHGIVFETATATCGVIALGDSNPVTFSFHSASDSERLDEADTPYVETIDAARKVRAMLYSATAHHIDQVHARPVSE